MPKIFISYRRADSRTISGRIYDRVVESFGKDNVFKDVDSIPLGSDFRGVLREAVVQCDVLLAIIGPKWLTVEDEAGSRRLDNPGDFVRIEIESALQRDHCVVIPVLVDNAAMPSADKLPLDLRELAFKNATQARDDPDFHPDITRLIKSLETRFGAPIPKPTAPAVFDVHAAVAHFYAAFEAKDWETARAVLSEIRASGRSPRLFDVDGHEKEIWEAIEAEERDKEYAVLQLMAKHSNPARIWNALQIFWQTYPGHDPDTLARFKPPPPKRSTSLDLLPRPFEWIDIPPGNVTLITEKGRAENYIPEGKSQTFPVAAFQIAKYPLTNAQFDLFMKAKGYENQNWWTPEGWQARTSNNWTQPRYWKDVKWNQPDHPVVGISWYESVAFCVWLSQTTGEKIRLPSEQEWQRAAQGDTNCDYPYGPKFDKSRCNFNTSGTTPVTQYPDGASPYGVMDMSGNVWEWCSTLYQTGENGLDGIYVRVLRGGSWRDGNPDNLRVVYRNWYSPNSRINYWGFRLARSLE